MESNNISYMRGYFAQAAELEKHVYVLREAMKKANSEMQIIYSEQASATSDEENYATQLANIDQKYIDKDKQAEESINNDKKNLPILKKRWIFFLSCAIACGLISFFGLFAMLAVLILFETIDVGVLAPFIGLLSCGIIPCLVLFIVNKTKASFAADRIKAGKPDFKQEKQTEKMQLIEKANSSHSKGIRLEKNKNEMMRSQDMISENYRIATQALQKLYGKNLIAPKYRRFHAMATFYEYLSTGRCLTVFGPGGVIDTYEKDIQMGIIINHLANIEAIVSDSNSKLGYLCQQAEEANHQLANINSNLASIKLSSAATAANTASIASYCSAMNASIHRMESTYF